MILVPRETVWPGQLPRNNDGTIRTRLKPDRPYLTCHYTGGGLWLDPNDTPEELKKIQQFAASASKRTPWEYNYVIDGQGLVWEYAGEYQAAHSAGENDIAIGVLLLVGFKGTYPLVEYWEVPTSQMIRAFQELRAALVATDKLAENHLLRQHNQMPGAATSCPGDGVKGVWSQLSAPLEPLPIPPDPIPPKPAIEDNMQVAAPDRKYDSRNDPAGTLKANETRTIYLGKEAEACVAAAINLTATGKASAGYVVAFGTATPPGTSNVNFPSGQTVANMAIVQVTGGRVNIRASAECDIIVDLMALWP
jgi:hypothetical protein